MADRSRLETAALVLPIFGALLCVPPLLGVFNVPVTIFGIPVVAMYLFSVWVGLIVATFVLSRALSRNEAESGGEHGEDGP